MFFSKDKYYISLYFAAITSLLSNRITLIFVGLLSLLGIIDFDSDKFVAVLIAISVFCRLISWAFRD